METSGRMKLLQPLRGACEPSRGTEPGRSAHVVIDSDTEGVDVDEKAGRGIMLRMVRLCGAR